MGALSQARLTKNERRQSADAAPSVGVSGAFNAFELDDNKVVLGRKKK